MAAVVVRVVASLWIAGRAGEASNLLYDSLESVAQSFGDTAPPTSVQAANRRRASTIRDAEAIQQMRVEPPEKEFDEEEADSEKLPSHMHCDACHALTFQAKKLFREATDGGARRLDEYEVGDLLEKLCRYALTDYGVKHIEGRRRLSGPGTWAEGVTSMMTGGGKWPKRLYTRCMETIGDIGEEAFYEMWLRDRQELPNTVCVDATQDCAERAVPRKRPKVEAAKKKKKKPKERTKEEL